jgi:pimeloyl-ACP methyl ester carboxylesterase
MPKEYVLVHGACHGAWCWDDVAAALRAKGHRVVALDLPGHGRRAAQARQASVGGYARAVADAMAEAGVSRGIVVGHSMGGVVIQKTVELAPDRVASLVFLAAPVVPSGASLAETVFPPATRALVEGMAAARGDGAYLYPAEIAWARWMNDLPRGHPAVVRALTLLTLQPLRPFFERVDLTGFYAMRVPRSYIRCLRDVAVPVAKAAASAARLGVKPIDMDAAHDVMLSKPRELARILERL